MPKKPLSAAATGLPKSETETCPVAALVREFNRAVERENELDHRSNGLDSFDKIKNRELIKMIFDHRNFIEEQASWLLAKSGLGALFQLALLHDAVHDLTDFELSEEKKADRCQRIDRLAYSLFDFIGTSTGARLGSTGETFYMPDRLNPHMQLAKALAGAEATES